MPCSRACWPACLPACLRPLPCIALLSRLTLTCRAHLLLVARRIHVTDLQQQSSFPGCTTASHYSLAPATPPIPCAAGQGRGGSGRQEDGDAMEDADWEGRQELSFGAAAGTDGGAGAASGAGVSRALQLSLPAQLGMEPEDLQRIRDGLFASTQQARQPPAKQRRILTVGPSQQAAAGAATAAAAAAQAAAAVGAAAAAVRPALAARNAWRKQQAAPVRAPAAGHAAAPRTPPPGGLPPLLPAGPSPITAAGKQCLVPAPHPAASQQGADRCLPDAGLYGGAAFRAGWAPNGAIAHAGGRPSSAAHLVVRQLSVGARVAPAGEPAGADSAFQERQRKALEAALQLHLEWSSADEGSDGDASVAGVPRWRLRCERQGQLRALTLRYIELCNAAAAEVGAQRCCPARSLPGRDLPACVACRAPLSALSAPQQPCPPRIPLPTCRSGSTRPGIPRPPLTPLTLFLCISDAAQARGAERSVLRHQSSTWELLHVLFSAIEGEKPARRAQQGADTAMGEEDELQLDRLAAFKRRAQLRWGCSGSWGCTGAAA